MRGIHIILVVVSVCACEAADTEDAGVDMQKFDLNLALPDFDTDLPDGPVDDNLDMAIPADATPPPPDMLILHDLTELTIEGVVTVGQLVGAGNAVRVVARCNDAEVSVHTDDDGRYELTSNVEACNVLIVEFIKESFLPVSRVVHLPPPTSPVTIDVHLAELNELICGEDVCVEENSMGTQLSPDPISRGFVHAFSGHASMRFVGGEMYDGEGHPLWVPAFSYYDLRDAQGVRIDRLPPYSICTEIERDSLDQLGDVTPGNDRIDVPIHSLDPSTGRWIPFEMGYIAMTEVDDEDLVERIVPAPEARLGSIRGAMQLERVWACGTLLGSGWRLVGVPVQGRACVRVEVENQCGRPVANTVMTVTGRDHGFRAVTWTDRRGEACLELARSEEIGEDLNFNGERGETVFADLLLEHGPTEQLFPAQEMLRTEGSCRDPDTCVLIEHQLFDPEVECP